eukprot:TRINITY_DN46146_c0_g1_i1.p1 TRINITY_DN46146_c0_g1~~TRINITY_DN46146_c0_g1_i1.p1  ORF type:complete len:252 (-),score=89.09 TRINITY_DN46146_c0_g1_i1:52-807(-)
MSSKKEPRKRERRNLKNENDDDVADQGPQRPFAQKFFTQAIRPPPRDMPMFEENEEVMHKAEQLDIDPAFVPEQLRQELRLPLAPKLPPALQEVVQDAGSSQVSRAIKQIVNKQRAHIFEEEKKPPPPVVGSMQLDEQMLRKIFQKMDLDHNETINARILKHFFNQMGEAVTNEELAAMIAMIDSKEAGYASYEDFAGIFSNPAEALMTVNVENVKRAYSGEAMKELMKEVKEGLSDSEADTSSDEEDDSD